MALHALENVLESDVRESSKVGAGKICLVEAAAHGEGVDFRGENEDGPATIISWTNGGL